MCIKINQPKLSISVAVKHFSKTILLCMLSMAMQLVGQTKESMCANCIMYPYSIEVNEPFKLDYNWFFDIKINIPPCRSFLSDGEYVMYYMDVDAGQQGKEVRRIAARFFIRKNMLEGKAQFYHYLKDSLNPRPLLVMSGNYKEGLRQGFWEFTDYSQFGDPVVYANCTFDKGLLNGGFYFRSAEKGIITGTYKNNLKEGVWHIKKSTLQFEEDKLNGTQYDTFGIFALEGVFEKGIPKGDILVKNKFYGNVEAIISHANEWWPSYSFEERRRKFQLLNLDPLMNELMWHEMFEFGMIYMHAENIKILNALSAKEINVNFQDTLLVWDYTKFLYSKTYRYRDSNGIEKEFKYSAKETVNSNGSAVTLTMNNVLCAEYQLDKRGKQLWHTIFVQNLQNEIDLKEISDHHSVEDFFGYMFSDSTLVTIQIYFYTYALLQAEKTPESIILSEIKFNEKDSIIRQYDEIYMLDSSIILLSTLVFRNGKTVKTGNFEFDEIHRKLQIDMDGGNNLDSNFNRRVTLKTIPITTERLMHSEQKPLMENYSGLFLRNKIPTNEEVFCFKNKPFTGTLVCYDSAIKFKKRSETNPYESFPNNIQRVDGGLKVKTFFKLFCRDAYNIGEKEALSILRVNNYLNGKKMGLQCVFQEVGKDSFLLTEYDFIDSNKTNRIRIETKLHFKNKTINADGIVGDIMANINQYEKDSLSGLQGYLVIGQKGVRKGFKNLFNSNINTITEIANQIAKEYVRNMKVIGNYRHGKILDGKLIAYNSEYLLETNITGNRQVGKIEVKHYKGNLLYELLLDEAGNGYFRNYSPNLKNTESFLYSELNFSKFRPIGEYLTFFQNGSVSGKYFGMEKLEKELKVVQRDSFYELILLKSKDNDDLVLLHADYYNQKNFIENLGMLYSTAEANSNADSSWFYYSNGKIISNRVKWRDSLINGREETYYYNTGKIWGHLSFQTTNIGKDSLIKWDYYDQYGNLYCGGSGIIEDALDIQEDSMNMPYCVPKDINIFQTVKITKMDRMDFVYLKIMQPNNKTLYEGWYNITKKEKQGTWRFYNRSGRLVRIGKYKNDKKEGRWLHGDLTGVNNLDNLISSNSDNDLQEMLSEGFHVSVLYYINGELYNYHRFHLQTKVESNTEKLKYNYWFLPKSEIDNEKFKQISKKAQAEVRVPIY